MEKTSWGIEDIARILPHRAPFLFVDRVTRLVPDTSIEAERELRADEPHFAGHFPGNPIMPGVLITEALAQTSGLLLALSAMSRGTAVEGDLFYLARADMKWTSPVTPGELLQLEAKMERSMGSLHAFRVRARTKRADVASGALTLARAEK